MAGTLSGRNSAWQLTFTQYELRIVITVTTIVASLMFPGFASARENPKQTHDPDYVPLGNSAYAAANTLQAHKLLLGFPKGYFAGKKAVTRQDFCNAVQRCVHEILEPDPPSAPAPPGSIVEPGFVSATELKLVRRLYLQFKPTITLRQKDGRAADDYLRKLQDMTLRIEIDPALDFPSATNDTKPGDEVKRPDWAYDAIEYFSNIKIVPPVPKEKLLTRGDIAAIICEIFNALYGAENVSNDGGRLDEHLPTFELNDVINLRQLVDAYRIELALQGVDLKAIQERITKALEKRILLEETISLAQ